MKTKFSFLSLVTFLAFTFVLGITGCTKTADTTDATLSTELTMREFQTLLIGSWQVVEKGVEIAMHNGHICHDPNAAGKITYEVYWRNFISDEKRNFKQNGEYSQYSESATCQGSYKISQTGILEINTNCKNGIEKIETLTPSLLTVKQGSTFFKYRKVY